jgi:hypothetical protein
MAENREELLDKFIVKIFSLKNDSQQLVSTLSGSLVQVHKGSGEVMERVSIKHITAATPLDNGTI